MNPHEVYSCVQDTIIAILECRENGIVTPELDRLSDACFEYRRWFMEGCR